MRGISIKMKKKDILKEKQLINPYEQSNKAKLILWMILFFL